MARTRIPALLALAACALLAVPSAATESSASGAAKDFLWAFDSHAPQVRTGGPLYWRGGDAGEGSIGVETHPAVYLVWWGSQWRRGFAIRDRDGRVWSSRALQRYVRTFFSSVGGSAWAGVQTEYCAAATGGATGCTGASASVSNPLHQLKGEWTDSAPVPADVLSLGADPAAPDGAIERVARSAASRLGYDPEATYIVLAPPGGKTPSGPVWCGYHAQTTAPDGSGRLQYAFIPWLNRRWPGLGWGGCGMHSVNARSDAFGHGIFDAWSIVGGHEYAEAVTEPDDLGGVRDGWDDDYSAEAADKCAWSGLRNVWLGTRRFAVQPLWSNRAYAATGDGCVVSG
ncbi:MAG TPA: hypothetical protein VHD91_12295 [Gaiellaceae bacterium]|nr:hypothetical protein [Gaiellaceae bacterium]